MTILGPDGTPMTGTTAAIPATTITDTFDPVAYWGDMLPGEQLCGAATLAGALGEQYRMLAQAGAQPDQILQVFGQMLYDIGQIHVGHHADASEAVVEATVSDVPITPTTEEEWNNLPILRLDDLGDRS